MNNKMGIFKRFKTITMAEINGLLDGIEDPIAMLNEYSREMEKEIAKGQQALARQIFVEKKQTNMTNRTQYDRHNSRTYRMDLAGVAGALAALLHVILAAGNAADPD